MTKAETISYAIEKECARISLTEWCKEWEFTVEEFYKFLDAGKKNFWRVEE